MPLPPNLFSVDCYDLKFLSFKFGNDIFIFFEIPRVAYNRPVRKINILLLFRPSVIRGPLLIRLLRAIFILRKDIGVGGWSRKWQFSLTLCS